MKKQQQVFIDIPNASIYLTECFPNDPQADIQLIFKSKHYKLQKSILKQSSKYFERVLQENTSIFQVKKSFNEQIFDGILSVIYGSATGIDRIQVPQYYQLAKFLEIEHIQQTLYKDINDCFEQYDTFVIMKLAHDINDDNLFKRCLQQLQLQSFEQMKYHQLSLLDMEQVLFNLIIKSHNQYKKKTNKGLSYLNINKLIKNFCQSHNIGNIRIQEMKVDLINSTLLTADEYKQIFMDPLTEKLNKKLISNRPLSANKQEFDNIFKKKIGIVLCRLEAERENYSMGNQQEFKETILYLENIYLRKMIKKLQKQNEKLSEEMKYKQQSPSRRRNTISGFNLKDKQQQENKNDKAKGKSDEKQKQKLNEFFQTIDKLSQQFEQKIEEIANIVNVYEQKKKLKSIQKSINLGSSQSSGLFLSSNFVHEMMTKNVKSAPVPKLAKRKFSLISNPIDSINLQQVNQSVTNTKIEKDNKIVFENIPTCISTSSVPVLYNFIRPEGFKTIHLSLIYRRSINGSPKGNKHEIYDQNQMLILFKTKNGTQAGGYISRPLQFDKQYIADQNAFFFNLMKQQKFKVAKESASYAIIVLENRLISFSNDLVIASQCTAQKSFFTLSSYQHVPFKARSQGFRAQNSQKNQNESITILDSQEYSSYSSNMSPSKQNSSRTRNAGLDLPSQFQIQCIQIFGIKEAELQMVL